MSLQPTTKIQGLEASARESRADFGANVERVIGAMKAPYERMLKEVDDGLRYLRIQGSDACYYLQLKGDDTIAINIGREGGYANDVKTILTRYSTTGERFTTAPHFLSDSAFAKGSFAAFEVGKKGRGFVVNKSGTGPDESYVVTRRGRWFANGTTDRLICVSGFGSVDSGVVPLTIEPVMRLVIQRTSDKGWDPVHCETFTSCEGMKVADKLVAETVERAILKIMLALNIESIQRDRERVSLGELSQLSMPRTEL